MIGGSIKATVTDPDGLVERLRKSGSWIITKRVPLIPQMDDEEWRVDPLCAEAADEIERLRAALAAAGVREAPPAAEWLRDEDGEIVRAIELALFSVAMARGRGDKVSDQAEVLRVRRALRSVAAAPVGAATSDRRCSASGTYAGMSVERRGPDRIVCPSCGRSVSAHRVTGGIARYNKPATALAPGEDR